MRRARQEPPPRDLLPRIGQEPQDPCTGVIRYPLYTNGMDTTTKTCSRCKRGLPFDKFYKKNTSKDGLTSHCRDCAKTPESRAKQAAHVRAYRQRHPEKVNEWARKNPERYKELQRSWRQRNYETVTAKEKAYRDSHKEDVRRRTREWQVKNREHYNELQRNWRKTNRATVKRSEAARRKRVEDAVAYSISEKEMRRLYDSPCFACGTTDNITIDHLIPLSRGGRHSAGNYAPMCMSCNTSKGSLTWIEWKYSDRSRAVEVFGDGRPARAA